MHLDTGKTDDLAIRESLTYIFSDEADLLNF